MSPPAESSVGSTSSASFCFHAKLPAKLVCIPYPWASSFVLTLEVMYGPYPFLSSKPCLVDMCFYWFLCRHLILNTFRGCLWESKQVSFWARFGFWITCAQHQYCDILRRTSDNSFKFLFWFFPTTWSCGYTPYIWLYPIVLAYDPTPCSAVGSNARVFLAKDRSLLLLCTVHFRHALTLCATVPIFCFTADEAGAREVELANLVISGEWCCLVFTSTIQTYQHVNHISKPHCLEVCHNQKWR